MVDQYDLTGVSTASLRRYLLHAGWRSQTRERVELFVQTEEGQPDVELVLPRSATLAAQPKTIGSAVRSIAQVEQRDLSAVIADIRSMGFDVLRSRFPDPLVRNDAVQLGVAEQFISSVRRLLAASASTEISPERFFGRTRQEALEFAEHCRFAHTFKGSFGFTIESPLTANTEPMLGNLSVTPPFERRVMQRIARGLKIVRLAGASDDPDVIAREYRTGMNANMCDELVDMAEAAGGQMISFELQFSPEWASPPDIGREPSIELQPQFIEVIKEAAKQLRQRDIERNRVIEGRVVRLTSKQNPSELLHPTGAREVVILWPSDEFGEINVKAILQPQAYLEAVEAHKIGRRVAVSGTFERIGRSWMLSDTRNFRTIG